MTAMLRRETGTRLCLLIGALGLVLVYTTVLRPRPGRQGPVREGRSLQPARYKLKTARDELVDIWGRRFRLPGQTPPPASFLTDRLVAEAALLIREAREIVRTSRAVEDPSQPARLEPWEAPFLASEVSASQAQKVWTSSRLSLRLSRRDSEADRRARLEAESADLAAEAQSHLEMVIGLREAARRLRMVAAEETEPEIRSYFPEGTDPEPKEQEARQQGKPPVPGS